MVAITPPDSFKVASNKGGDMDKQQTDFEIWMQAMGFNGKQIGEAGARIGLTNTSARMTRSGNRDLKLVERLAMSAIRAGLPPWSPEDDAEVHGVGSLKETLASLQSSKD